MKKLRNKPFYLKETEIDFVANKLNEMTLDEKISQLFCLILYSDEQKVIDELAAFKPGGFMLRPMPVKQAIHTVKSLQHQSKIPLLLAANLEKGGSGALLEGTTFSAPMGIGATQNVDNARKLGETCAKEGSAVGLNYAFAPVIDINMNFRNPITNTRTFGSDATLVKEMGCEYVKTVQALGLATSIKHFPGDGVDERDQHLTTASNDLPIEEWYNTFGEAYKASINAGAYTVMVGHIMLPSFERKCNPNICDNEILPATLSLNIVTKLLREELEFNGVVITDSTTMIGLSSALPRDKAVPLTIAAGCDMFLFTRNLEEDFRFMKNGVLDGTITSERLNDAVSRILALKCKLGLFEKDYEAITYENAMAIVGCEEHKTWAAQCADKAITLVKSEKNVLPIDKNKVRKILFYGIEPNDGGVYGARTDASVSFVRMLREEGFEVEVFTPNMGLEGQMTGFFEVTQKYDMIIYLATLATKSNQTVVRIEWGQPMGANAPIYTHSIPTVFISAENPYHLLDVPMARTYINAYTSSDIFLKEIINKLMGRSKFKGVSPVDPFCNRWDSKR